MVDPLTCGARYLRQPTLVFHALERMEMLEPELMRGVCCDLLPYALVYVEQHRGDVPRLEREREFLCAALAQAWRQGRHADVLRLVEGLSYLVGRFKDADDADRILLWGIEAARQLGDKRRQACLLNRRGNLLFSHGQNKEGRRIWWESLNMAQGQQISAYLWEMFYSFVYISDILGGCDEVRHFAEVFQQADQLDSIAVALFVRGFRARFIHNLQQAHTDYQTCLQHLPRPENGTALSPDRQLFMMVVQAELARVQGDYPRSWEYSESALALARLYSDIYTVVDLLMDQGLFACQQGEFSDMYMIRSQVQTIACQTNAPLFHKRVRLLQHLFDEGTSNRRAIGNLRSYKYLLSAPTIPTILLSDRELEVLQLVAAGLSNNEIAARLVVTTSTVKKHLEHIYDRLNVSSRTHAVARGRELNLLP